MPRRKTDALRKAEKATQFGGVRANPSGADSGIAPHSIRQTYRRILALEVDSDLTEFDTAWAERLAQRVAGKGQRVNGAHMLAAQRFAKAMQGNMTAMDRIEDAVDGKLTDKYEVVDKRAEFLNTPLSPEKQAALADEILHMAENIKSARANTRETQRVVTGSKAY